MRPGRTPASTQKSTKIVNFHWRVVQKHTFERLFLENRIFERRKNKKNNLSFSATPERQNARDVWGENPFFENDKKSLQTGGCDAPTCFTYAKSNLPPQAAEQEGADVAGALCFTLFFHKILCEGGCDLYEYFPHARSDGAPSGT